MRIGLLLGFLFQLMPDISAARRTDHRRRRIATTGTDLIADDTANHCASERAETYISAADAAVLRSG